MSNDRIVPRTRKENAEYVISSFEALGIIVPAASRLYQMRDILTDESTAVIRPNDAGFETALEAERDFQVLAFIFDMAMAQASDPKFRDIVRMVLKDSVLPQANRDNSRGRDMQFELFVAAVCQSAGLMPIERDEPDVRFTLDGTKYGIAAKRVKNVKRLGERVKKAADQVAASSLPGFIALETSLMFNPENERITQSPPDAEFFLLYGRALYKHIKPYHDRLQEWVRGKGVRGIVFHDQQVRFEKNGEWSLAGMTITLCTARENQRRNREFQRFHKKYTRGLPDCRSITA